jgi:hypothetical protein
MAMMMVHGINQVDIVKANPVLSCLGLFPLTCHCQCYSTTSGTERQGCSIQGPGQREGRKERKRKRKERSKRESKKEERQGSLIRQDTNQRTILSREKLQVSNTKLFRKD